MTKPLAGLRIIEMAGIGPTPFCGMMLADHGVEVITVCRPGAEPALRDPLNRHRSQVVQADLKTSDGRSLVRELLRTADGLIEGFRPGVMERAGLGPDDVRAEHPALVYGRMTGWGQTGPMAQRAGHDINYIALSGALHAFGRAGEKPTPPANVVGDFGGGGMLLAFGMVAGLLQARISGKGSVIDCAMTDGSALLMSMIWGFRETLGWRDERGVNLLDGGAHFYDTYETADGLHVAIGAIEPQFYAELRRIAGVADNPAFDAQFDPAAWPVLRDRLAVIFKSRSRDEWCDLMAHADACFAPVLSMTEAPSHAHNTARGTFTILNGVIQPAPAPRFND